MARPYAQLFSVLFLILTAGALFAGTAGHVSDGQASGNFGNITLHLSWLRDIVDLLTLGALIYAGFVADRLTGKGIVTGVGAFYLLLAVIGFIAGDDDTASKGFATLHFPTVINVLDLVVGILGVLSGLGTEEDAELAA